MDNTDRITAIPKSSSRGSSQKRYAIDAVIRQSSIFANNNTHDADVTNNNGGKPAVKSTIISESFVNFRTDQTLSDLRKAIVGDLIKNPKTFKGNKD
ncbi:unnamed protein product, partial [Adineta steineri]